MRTFSNDIIFSFMREEIMFLSYTFGVFLSPGNSSYGFSLWLPELRVISCALSITCGLFLYCIENNNSQDHYLFFLVQFWAWLQEGNRYKGFFIMSYVFSFKPNPTSSGFTNFVNSSFYYRGNFFCQCLSTVALAQEVGWGPEQHDSSAPGQLTASEVLLRD